MLPARSETSGANVGSDPLVAIEANPVRRAKLRKAMAENSPAPPSGDPEANTPGCSGLLSRPTPGLQATPPAAVADDAFGSRGWRRVAALNVTDVLGR